jgi:hypothetical protein
MMATGASTAIASDCHALKDGGVPREPELLFQEVVTCNGSRQVAERRGATTARDGYALSRKLISAKVNAARLHRVLHCRGAAHADRRLLKDHGLKRVSGKLFLPDRRYLFRRPQDDI